MHAASGNQPEREPWKMSEQEKEATRSRSESPSKAEEAIAQYEASQKWAWDLVNPPDRLRKKLAPWLDQMKAHRDDAREFTEPLAEINHLLGRIRSLNARIPKSVTDDLVAELGPLLRHRISKPSLSIESLARIIAENGSSSEAKSVIIEALSSAAPSLKEAAFDGLTWNRDLRGDQQIYGKLAELWRAGGEGDLALLAAMTRVDREKTLPLLLAQLRATKDLKTFVRLSDGLSEYRRPELIEAILARLKDFPEDAGLWPLNPTVGIAPELLLSYIASAEDEKLELALKALEMNAIALRKSYPVLSKKLDGHSPSSRIATARCIKKAAELGAFGEESVVRDLESRAVRATEGEASSELRAAATAIRRHMERHEE